MCVFVTASDDSILHDNPWGAVCARKWEKGCSSFQLSEILGDECYKSCFTSNHPHPQHPPRHEALVDDAVPTLVVVRFPLVVIVVLVVAVVGVVLVIRGVLIFDCNAVVQLHFATIGL